MYDIRQFKPALYALLLLGISGYCISAQTPGIWVICCFFILLHAWLVRRGRFKPMPRVISNVVILFVLMYVVADAMLARNPWVLVIGQFLVLVQLVKLWELRGNRDYAQILVLGLLLMVAAAISTASLWYAVVLFGYLFLSLYCCLLFHLKGEAETAKAASGVPRRKFSAVTLRQDERYLPQSMMRLSTLMSLVGIVFGVAVFLVFPRGPSGGLLGNFQVGSALVGFSDEVSFQNIARIQQNNDVIAWVAVSHNGKPVQGTATLLLRGTTLDRYRGNSWPRVSQRYTWTHTDQDEEAITERGSFTRAPDARQMVARPQVTRTLEPPQYEARDPAQSLLARIPFIPKVVLPPATAPSDVWEQQITLKPTGTNVMFSMAGPLTITSMNHILSLRYYRSEQVIESTTPLHEPVDYKVTATNQVGGPTIYPVTVARRRTRLNQIDPQILAFAQRREVSGVNERGPLAAQRNRLHAAADRPDTVAPDPLDAQIAANIEKYLKTHYTYTLDLTDTRKIEGRDPLVAFLYDFKKGHCEYFAGAMTLLCQSLGLTSRMVVGFHCEGDAYVGGYYQVQQSHAHAWVEVLTTDGWKTYDPTSAIGAAPRKLSLWQEGRNFLNYLDFAYARTVIAYDGDNQTNLAARSQARALTWIYKLVAAGDTARLSAQSRWKWLGGWWNNTEYNDAFWTVVLRLFIALMVIALSGAVAWFLLDRQRLKRRAVRIGIASLPVGQQIRLAKQLAFYDDLLRILARHQIHRTREQTPLEFGRSLLFLPSDAYETVLRLTQLFYRVRYGQGELTPARRRHLDVVIDKLGENLNRKATTRGVTLPQGG